VAAGTPVVAAAGPCRRCRELEARVQFLEDTNALLQTDKEALRKLVHGSAASSGKRVGAEDGVGEGREGWGLEK